MAVGLGRMFGVRLPLNFDAPYKATNAAEFWRRWHITLSRFLRDYLYIPLGGNRKGRIRRYLNLMLTMLIGGLWHGASWTFVLWGGLHGLYLVANRAWQRVVPVSDVPSWFRRGVGWCLTFGAVLVAWVPFRVESLAESWSMYGSMFGLHEVTRGGADLTSASDAVVVLLLLASSLVLPTTHEYLARYRPALGYRGAPSGPRLAMFIWRPTPGRAVLTVLLFLSSAAMMQRPAEFLYFQF